MASSTVIYVRWKVTGRIEIFTNLGRLFYVYNPEQLGVSRHTLNKRDLTSGYSNEYLEMFKLSLR
jgi:hypothetical protein